MSLELLSEHLKHPVSCLSLFITRPDSWACTDIWSKVVFFFYWFSPWLSRVALGLFALSASVSSARASLWSYSRSSYPVAFSHAPGSSCSFLWPSLFFHIFCPTYQSGVPTFPLSPDVATSLLSTYSTLGWSLWPWTLASKVFAKDCTMQHSLPPHPPIICIK